MGPAQNSLACAWLSSGEQYLRGHCGRTGRDEEGPLTAARCCRRRHRSRCCCCCSEQLRAAAAPGWSGATMSRRGLPQPRWGRPPQRQRLGQGQQHGALAQLRVTKRHITKPPLTSRNRARGPPAAQHRHRSASCLQQPWKHSTLGHRHVMQLAAGHCPLKRRRPMLAESRPYRPAQWHSTSNSLSNAPVPRLVSQKVLCACPSSLVRTTAF